MKMNGGVVQGIERRITNPAVASSSDLPPINQVGSGVRIPAADPKPEK